MAKTITLRNVSERALEDLRARARRNGRSIQRELLSIVEAAAADRRSLEKLLKECRMKVTRPMSLREIHRAIAEGRH